MSDLLPPARASDLIRGTDRASAPDHSGPRASGRISATWLLYGILTSALGLACYLVGVMMAVPRHLLGNPAALQTVNEWLVWYSGIPVLLGFLMALADLFLLLKYKRKSDPGVRKDDLGTNRVVVALTAYDDESSISDAVHDFLRHPQVDEVIVVSNNSRDRTLAFAAEAGATAVNEPQQGYGQCVHRCLREALQRDTNLIVLCEGDRTFRAQDIDKLLAYAPHADIVNGTRTVEALRARDTQLSTFMYYGNLFVGKVLEAKHLGRSTITDVGTTYKLCRRDALVRLLPKLDPTVNLEFNAHFLDAALLNGYDVVECPISFHPRVGVSKGGNVNNGRALRVGLRMLFGITCSWRPLAS